MLAIFKKEIRAYFITPIGYVFIALFLAVNGVLFSVNTLRLGRNSNINAYFYWIILALVLLVPILTMKVFTEEKKMRTEQLLLSAPVPLFKIVVAKYLAAYAMFVLVLGIASLNFIILTIYGSPNFAIFLGSMISLLLIGAACVAIGVFFSALTENQFIAATSTMAVLLTFVGMNLFNDLISSTFLRGFFNWFSLLARFNLFSFGFFDLQAILYYVSVAAVFIFLTIRVYEKKRWN